MIKCKLCGADEAKVIYHGVIKTGLLDGYTAGKHDVFQCEKCKTIWNNAQSELGSEFYESAEYRNRIGDDSSEVSDYYMKYDKNVLDYFNYTGTDIFRNKIVADIGCAGGGFLDFVSGVAKEIVAVEPSRAYQKALKAKGYHAFQYASLAADEFKGKCDVITSWDVIEHVEDPQQFANEMYKLSSPAGKIIVGTPTDYPVLRQMLGDDFNKFIFQIQHPWVLSKESMTMIFEKAGYNNVRVVSKQKYGLGNLLAWLKERIPRGDIKYDFVSDSLDALYKQEMGKIFGEYLVLYATKNMTCVGGGGEI